MILFDQRGIALRTLEPGDERLLLKWLTDPLVLEWYGGRDQPYDSERVREDFYDEDSGEEVRGIVLHEGRPIGYMQFYPLEDEERGEYGYSGDPSVIYGMDQFIGEPDCRDRGIGSRLIAEAANYLFTEKRADKLVMDPQVRNERALRVYEKNGFVRVKRLESRELHEGVYEDCWLIEKKRPE
ncbi:GNAT family N-acetyltransferase [Saccharibacillus sp. CPCC 101409]|uniref:GNAT family N-acetyltransferase n=1 Tax=Saccharibacillus sp. CPCC 101409 TaxID=3058041 RepID=UPI0026725B60|nr:GNAT family N-acetyltransferase [Saccharibacillus sp. CPCC 101409]MDO3410512.1 GNAT family N-acetyltransferase [Saccharibacillus sp. CPCC 101409]